MKTSQVKPILFTSPMIRALLDGRKTQTRRLIKPQPAFGCYYAMNGSGNSALHLIENGTPEKYCCPVRGNLVDHKLPCPFGKKGDLLWVRETWQPFLKEGFDFSDVNYATGEGYAPGYVATDGVLDFVDADDKHSGRCTPSIHMPKWASRLTLEITDVRVERLQEISRADSIAEGVERNKCPTHETIRSTAEPWGTASYSAMCAHSEREIDYIGGYRRLWDSLYAKTSPWESNPWVWRLDFTVHKKNVNELLEERA